MAIASAGCGSAGCTRWRCTRRPSAVPCSTVRGRHYQFAYRYESWVQFRSRPVRPRVDLAPLATALSEAESAAGGVGRLDGRPGVGPHAGARAGRRGGERARTRAWCARWSRHTCAPRRRPGTPSRSPADPEAARVSGYRLGSCLSLPPVLGACWRRSAWPARSAWPPAAPHPRTRRGRATTSTTTNHAPSKNTVPAGGALVAIAPIAGSRPVPRRDLGHAAHGDRPDRHPADLAPERRPDHGHRGGGAERRHRHRGVRAGHLLERQGRAVLVDQPALHVHRRAG